MARRSPYSRPDARTRAAKALGYAARSVFKLEEIDRRHRLLKKGQRVLDLGAAPGSWSKYAGERVGPEGHVLAIDLRAIDVDLGANVETRIGDALDLTTDDLAAGAPYDVVLSDMAPSTSGSKVSDQARSYELFTRALEVACASLRPGGSFVGKIFMSEDFAEAKRAVGRAFAKVQTVRPRGTRQQSSEVFLLGVGRRQED